MKQIYFYVLCIGLILLNPAVSIADDLLQVYGNEANGTGHHVVAMPNGSVAIADDYTIIAANENPALSWTVSPAELSINGGVGTIAYLGTDESGDLQAIVKTWVDGEHGVFLFHFDANTGTYTSNYKADFRLYPSWEVKALPDGNFVGLEFDQDQLVKFNADLDILWSIPIDPINKSSSDDPIFVNDAGEITVIANTGVDSSNGLFDYVRLRVSSDGTVLENSTFTQLEGAAIPLILENGEVWLHDGESVTGGALVRNYNVTGLGAPVVSSLPLLPGAPLPPGAINASTGGRVIDAIQLSNGRRYLIAIFSATWIPAGSDVGALQEQYILVELETNGFAIDQWDLTAMHNFDAFNMAESHDGQLLISGSMDQKITAVLWGVEQLNCGCDNGYAPVCTPDGIQYANACLANCAGENSFTSGECTISDEQVSICPGETAELPEPMLLGPPDNFDCPLPASSLSITPNIGVEAILSNQVNVSPEVTTTYVVVRTFPAGPQGPDGVNCPSWSISKEYTVVVKPESECVPLPTDPVTCPGVPVQVLSPPYGPTPPTPCFSTGGPGLVTVSPETGVVSANDTDGFWFAPTVTTTYTVTRYYDVAGPVCLNCPECPDITVSFQYTINVIDGVDCPASGIDLPAYPWASEVPDGPACQSFSEVIEFSLGGYQYLYFEAQENSGVNSVLYNATGQLYCTESGNFDCIAAYGFVGGSVIWSCEDGPIGCDCVFVDDPVCGSDGVQYSNACEAACAGVTYTEGPCTVDCDCPIMEVPVCGTDGVEYPNACVANCFGVAFTDGPCGSGPGTEGLEDYPWAPAALGSLDCSNYTSVVEYTSGSYKYLYFSAAPNSGLLSVLYNASGQLYCTETGNYDCVAAYGFGAGTQIWNCNSEPPIECDCDLILNPVCGSDGEEYSNACFADCAGVSWTEGPCDSGPGPNTGFAWLDQMLLSMSCCEAGEVGLWRNSNYEYIYIEPQAGCGEGMLYNASGQFYCQSSSGYDCLSIYGLSFVQVLYSCNEQPPLPSCEYDTSGQVFFDTCAGQSYFLIQLENGVILDPYLLDQEFEFIDGELVEFTYVIPDFSSPCTNGAIAVDLICIRRVDDDPIPGFDDYPWLVDLVDEFDCCANSQVLEYSSGIYSYIVIESAESCGGSQVMYSSSGQFYCSSSPGYDCLALYGIENWEVNVLWNCLGKNETSIDAEQFLYDLSVYPNPSTGPINITVNGDLENAEFRVLDVNGQLIYRQPAIGETTLELDQLAPGMYLLQVLHQKQSLVERIIIN